MELQKRSAVETPLDDEQIIALYFARDEKTIEETDFKYKKYLFSVVYNVLYDPLCCEECVNDTYLGAWNEIPPPVQGCSRRFLPSLPDDARSSATAWPIGSVPFPRK